MPKARKQKRKAPVTLPESPARSASFGSSSNPASTRTLIRRFHVLIKRKAQLQGPTLAAGSSHGVANVASELEDIEREIERLGGLEAYQRMSSIGQGDDRGGGSEKILIGWLKELKAHTGAQQRKLKLRLLEVGALKPDNYASCAAWIANSPIDLRSCHPSIREQDFLLLDEQENRAQWDIISLSLVLNFVPEAKDRGQMLRLAHSMLRSDALLFVALPLPCILNSRYLTPEHFDALVQAIGLSVIRTRWKEGGKMAYWLLSKNTTDPLAKHTTSCAPFEKKTVLRPGKRNNFAILL